MSSSHRKNIDITGLRDLYAVGLMTLSVVFTLVGSAPAIAEDRALLVGIDRYGDHRIPHTIGATADAKALAHLLESRFGFEGENIRLLLNEEATAEEIVASFESWLIEGTQVGDRVFFHYAGHGSQLPDDNGDEEDERDETLAPYDVEVTTGGNHIRDDVLDALVSRLANRRAVLLFDSCHSGTITRSVSDEPRQAGVGARYLPGPEEMRRLWPEGEGVSVRSSDDGAGVPGEGPTYQVVADPSDSENRVLDDPRKLANLNGIVVISAARPGQLAYPLETEEGYRGALSYTFEQLFAESNHSRSLFKDIVTKGVKNVGGVLKGTTASAIAGNGGDLGSTLLTGTAQSISLATVETSINHGIKRLQGEGRLEGGQEPWFEVISEHPIESEPLWGSWEQEAAVALQNPLAAMKVELHTVPNKTVFRKGEEISFEITSGGGFLYLLVFSQNQQATCIFPNPSDMANQVSAGTISIPTKDSYVFPVQSPYGRDVVIAVVSEDRLNLCNRISYTWSEIYESIDLREVHERLRWVAKRGIGVGTAPSTPSVEAASPNANGTPTPIVVWQTASTVIETTQ